jgi:hypothetical protein
LQYLSAKFSQWFLKNYQTGSKSSSRHETGYLSSKLSRTSGCSTPIVPIFFPYKSTLAPLFAKNFGSESISWSEKSLPRCAPILVIKRQRAPWITSKLAVVLSCMTQIFRWFLAPVSVVKSITAQSLISNIFWGIRSF